MELIVVLMVALLGFGAGIFTVLSLIEKPAWWLMWSETAPVEDRDIRSIHMTLKSLIHVLPPTMMVLMAGVSGLMIWWWLSGGEALIVTATAFVFFAQLLLILTRLFRDINGVKNVTSDSDITLVREGLASLMQVHHRGLLMTTSTLIVLLLIA